MKKFASTIRELRQAQRIKNDEGVDITTFLNFYGTLENSQKFNTPGLIKKASWWDRLLGRV